MTVVINHSNQLSLSYSQKPTVLLPFNKLSKTNVNNTIYASLIFKDTVTPFSPSAELDRITVAEEMARFARNSLIAARFALKAQHQHVFVRFSITNTLMIVIQIKNKKHVIQVLL